MRGYTIAAIGTLLVAYASVTATSWLSCAYLWSLAAAYVTGYFLPTLRPIWLGVGTGLCLWLVARYHVPFELNPNALGAALALAFAAALAYEWYGGAAIMFAGAVLTQSRTAILAIGVVAFVACWKVSKLIAVCAALATVALIWAYSGGRSESLLARFGIWQDTLNHLTFWGHGWGSFAQTYAEWPVKTNMTFALAPAVYNDYLQLVFELGIVSALAWVLVMFSLEGEGRSLPLLALATLSLSFFPLYIPIVGHLGLLALGHAAQRSYQDG